MKIEDVMTRRVVAARADTDLAHVARLMWDNDCGCVPVVDAEDKVVGLVTDRDVAMSAHFQGRSLRELFAGACMAAELATCRPKDDAEDVLKLMGERRVRRIPVTDAGGRLVGLVAFADLFASASKAPKKKKKALNAALLEALTAITARPPREEREEVVPAAPAKKRDKGEKAGNGKSNKGERAAARPARSPKGAKRPARV